MVRNMLYGKALHKKAGRILALLMALMLIFSVCGAGVFAEPADGDAGESNTADTDKSSVVMTIPEPSESFYIYDEANVLTEATENEIITRNTELNTKYGMQIVVVTMNEMPGADFDARVTYANKIIQEWKIGGEKGYGLLLVLSISDLDYVAVAADGFKTEFSSTELKTLLDEQLEPSFKVEAYDVGVKTFVTAAADKAEKYMAPSAAAEDAAAGGETERTEKEGNVFLSILKGIGIFLLVVLILLVLLLVVVNIHGQMVRKKRREARRRRAAEQRSAGERRPRPTSTDDDYKNFMNRY